VQVEHCTPYLFGLIPLNHPWGLGELLTEATGQSPGLVSISLDGRFTFWLVGYSLCYRVTGQRLASESTVEATRPEPPAQRQRPAQAQAEEAPARQRTPITPADGSSPEEEIRTKYLLVLYASAGLQMPEDDKQITSDVATIRHLLDAGYDFPALLDITGRGARRVGEGATLTEVLRAGLSSAP
jgi:hypothetical protein